MSETIPFPKSSEATEAVRTLLDAISIIEGPRQNDYGDRHVMHGRIAALWKAYLGVEICAADVALMMVLLKVARSTHSVGRDSFIDMAGYAAIASEIIQKELKAEE